MTSERYLVTGGAGFIGSHIVGALLEQGVAVRVLDNFSSGQYKNLASVIDQIELVEGDLSNLDAIRRAVADISVVFHQAALVSVPHSVKDPLISHHCNATGTLNLLLACREAGVRRVVYASSASVYGNNGALPKREDMLQEPISPYAVSKLAGEQYCQAFYQIYGLETVCLRYFNVFGPRQDPNSPYAAVITKFIMRMLQGEPPLIQGDGLQSRDFTYVANNVRANILAATALDVAGKVFNVASGQSYTLRELVDSLNCILQTDFEPIYTESRLGDVRHSEAEIRAAQRSLHYEPIVGFQDGLERTVAWFRTQLNGSLKGQGNLNDMGAFKMN